MNRGWRSSGRAACTAGLNRSVCPTASVAPPRAAAAISEVGLLDRSCERLLDQHRHAALEQRLRHRRVRRRRRRDGDCVHLTRQCRKIRQHRGLHGGGNLLRPLAVEIEHADEVHVRQAGQQPGVMSAELPDANHGDAKRRYAHDRLRATMAIPAASAAATTAARSNTSVLPASIDRADAPAVRIASIVGTPTTGTSNRMS